jgi:hypothetical protein
MVTQHNPREGFLVGEMLAQYGQELPAGADEHMRQGYATIPDALKGRGKLADRYVRKYLQVRVGAWRRNRLVDDSFTIEMLRSIDTQKCPVSGVVLTHGTGQDTDWSVDRLDNNKGYLLGNVVILSTRVNEAKGSLGPEEIHQRALARQDCDGLTGQEWLRLGYLVGCSLTGAASELMALPLTSLFEQTPVGVSVPFWAIFEGCLAYATFSSSAKEREMLWMGMEQSGGLLTAIFAAQLYKTIVFAIRSNKKLRLTPLELFQDPEVWEAFSRFWPLYKRTEHCAKVLLRFQESLIQKACSPGSVRDLDVHRFAEQEAARGYC